MEKRSKTDLYLFIGLVIACGLCFAFMRPVPAPKVSYVCSRHGEVDLIIALKGQDKYCGQCFSDNVLSTNCRVLTEAPRQGQ